MTSADELERLIKAGTPGPLEIETAPDREPWIKGATGEWLAMCCGHTDEKAEANAALICAAVNALPELVAIRDAARTALGCLDDPTGGDHVNDMRRASDVLRAALNQEGGQ